jgi:hypothetical protein
MARIVAMIGDGFCVIRLAVLDGPDAVLVSGCGNRFPIGEHVPVRACFSNTMPIFRLTNKLMNTRAVARCFHERRSSRVCLALRSFRFKPEKMMRAISIMISLALPVHSGNRPFFVSHGDCFH